MGLEDSLFVGGCHAGIRLSVCHPGRPGTCSTTPASVRAATKHLTPEHLTLIASIGGPGGGCGGPGVGFLCSSSSSSSSSK